MYYILKKIEPCEDTFYVKEIFRKANYPRIPPNLGGILIIATVLARYGRISKENISSVGVLTILEYIGLLIEMNIISPELGKKLCKNINCRSIRRRRKKLCKGYKAIPTLLRRHGIWLIGSPIRLQDSYGTIEKIEIDEREGIIWAFYSQDSLRGCKRIY